MSALAPNTPITQENAGLLKAGEPFERHPALASWIERLGNTAAGLSLGEWMTFIASLNLALLSERKASQDWQPMRTAPKDGTEIETLCVHPTAHYSTDAFGEGWAAVVKAKWLDHNDGGWTWHGLCGVHMAWRPRPALAKPADKRAEALSELAALDGETMDLPVAVDWERVGPKLVEAGHALLAHTDGITLPTTAHIMRDRFRAALAAAQPQSNGD